MAKIRSPDAKVPRKPSVGGRSGTAGRTERTAPGKKRRSASTNADREGAVAVHAHKTHSGANGTDRKSGVQTVGLKELAMELLSKGRLPPADVETTQEIINSANKALPAIATGIGAAIS